MEQELNQTEAVEEQEQEKPSEPVSKATPAEEKATSRERTEEEFRKIQSMKDKAESTLKSVQDELQKLREQQKQERLLARQRELADLEGDTDGQSKVRHKHQLEDELLQLQERREKEEGAVARKYDQASELAKQYNLNLSEARELLDATTPREMELMAQLKAREKEKIQGKVQTKEETEGFVPDSSHSEGSPSDFKQLEKNFIKDPYKYGKQFKEALAKRGQ